jgi:Arc/MetJ family transcription regulator
MRTNIVLDEALVKLAFAYANVRTKKDLIHLALKEFVAAQQRKDIRELKGKVKIDPDYDYKASRLEKE